MNFDAMKLIEQLNAALKSDRLNFRQKEMAEVARNRLTSLETNYRTSINDALADLEDVGVKL